jgi:hypothetical protein
MTKTEIVNTLFSLITAVKEDDIERVAENVVDLGFQIRTSSPMNRYIKDVYISTIKGRVERSAYGNYIVQNPGEEPADTYTIVGGELHRNGIDAGSTKLANLYRAYKQIKEEK